MVMRRVMRHARTLKFQLSGPTVHSLYCGLVRKAAVLISRDTHVFHSWANVGVMVYIKRLIIKSDVS